MSKAYSCVGEEQFHAYHILGDLVRSKDYVNQFGKFHLSLRQCRDLTEVKPGLSRQALFKTVNDILERLETDYLDFFWIHRFDPETPIEETMCALNDLVRAGKIRYIGASSMWTYQFAMMQHCAEMNGWTKFVAMQGRYNLLYREEEREMNKYCNTTGVAIIPVSIRALVLLALETHFH